MLDALPLDRAVKLDRTSHRRLDPLLIETDIQLRLWASHARGYYATQFPIAADVEPVIPRSAWPAEVLATDVAVQSLCWQLAAAIMAHYFNRPAERAEAYAMLIRHFKRLQPTRAHESPSGEGLHRYVDRARWSVRALLVTPDSLL